MGIQERRLREKENIKRLIAEAAKELFIEEGIESVSMRKIASKIEYSPTTLYNYYHNKTEILKTLVEDYFREYAPSAEKHRDNTELSPLDNLKSYLRLSVTRALENPGMYLLLAKLFSESAQYKFGISGAGKGYGLLVDLIQECIDNGDLSAGNVDLKAQSLWSVTHGLSSLLVSRPGFHWEDIDTLINSTIDAVLKGMA